MQKLMLVFAAIAVVACGSDSPAAPTLAALSGTWQLQSVNGQSLPYLLGQTANEKDELLADVFQSDAGGGFIETTTLRVTENGQASTEIFADSGHFEVSNGVLHVFFQDGSVSLTGQVAGNTMTVMANGGLPFTYKK